MKKFVFTIVALSLSVFSSQSFAGEGVSYSAKKQGRVPFNTAKEETATVDAEASAEDLSDLEPAAGAEDAVEEEEATSSVAEDIKLPRKR